MALTPEEILRAEQAQARLNKLVETYNDLTGRRIQPPVSSETIKNAENLASVLDNINNQIQVFEKLNKETAATLRKNNREVQNLKASQEELNRVVEKYNKLTGQSIEVPTVSGRGIKAQKEYNRLIADFNRRIVNIDTGLNDIVSRFQDIGREIKSGFGNPVKEATKSINRIFSITEQLADAQSDLTQANVKDLENQKRRVRLEFERLNRQLRGLELQKEEIAGQRKRIANDLKNGKITQAQADRQYANLQSQENKVNELLDLASQQNKDLIDQNGLIEDMNDAYDKTIDRINQINKATGITGKLLEGAGGALEKLGFKGISKKVEDINQELKDQAVILTDNGQKTANFGMQVKILQKGVIGLGDAFVKSLTDPLVVIGVLTKAFKALIDIGMHASQAATDMGRELGLAGKQAADAYHQVYAMAQASGDAFSNAKEFVKANQELNAALGTSIVYSQDQLEVQNMLTRQMGLSGEEAANIAKMGALNGQTSEQVVDSILKQTDGLINAKEVAQEVASVSADTAALYKNNPGLIAKAVMKVKQLGMSMKDAKNISEGLLDFESSIQAELEAQLITGRSMNLARARELALQGKTAEAAEEARKQLGSYDDFMKAGPIGQKAMADALGMSTEELGKQLQTTETIAKLRKDPKYAGLSNEQLTQQAMRQNMSASERLADTMQTVKEAFASMIEGPLATAVEYVSKIFKGFIDNPIMKTILGGVGLVGFGAALGGTVFALYKMIGGFIKNLVSGKVGESENRPNISQETSSGQQSLADKIGKSVAANMPDTGGGGSLGDQAQDAFSDAVGGDDDGGYYDKQGRYRDKKTGKYKKKPQAQGKPGSTGSKAPKGPKAPKVKTPKGSKMPKVKPPKGGGALKMLKGMGGGAMMSGLSMVAQAAPLAMSGFGRSLESQGAEAGNRTKETIGSSMAQAGDVGVAKQSIGFLGQMGGFLSKMNPKKLVTGAISKFGGKFLKAIPNIAKKIPYIGGIIEGIFAAKDIAGMMASGMPEDDIYQNIGRRSLQAIGGILGAGGASMAIQAANIVPGLGVILTPLAGLAGDFIGRSLGGLLADASPSLSQSIGKGISDVFGQTSKIQQGDKIQNAAGAISKDQGGKPSSGAIERGKEYAAKRHSELQSQSQTIKANDFTIQTNPADTLVMAGGTQFGKETNDLLRELLSAIKQGGNVYIDGNKAGEALVLGSYKSA